MAKRINVSLIAGEDGCSIEGGIRLVKLAYSYEQWEVFDALIENILTYIRVSVVKEANAYIAVYSNEIFAPDFFGPFRPKFSEQI